MGQPSVIGKTYADYPIDMVYPELRQMGPATGFDDKAMTKYGIQTAFFSAGADVLLTYVVHDGLMCLQVASDGAGDVVQRDIFGASMYLPLYATGTTPTFKFPVHSRVWIFDFVMALGPLTAFPLTSDTGVPIMLCTAAAPGVLYNGGNRGFGILGDPAVPGGGWRYVEKDDGVANTVNYQLPLVWPSALTSWVWVAYELRAATPNSNARVLVYLNGVLTVSRVWGATSRLPLYTQLANSGRFSPCVCGYDAANVAQLRLGAMRFRQGNFDLNGAEV